jgi:hypothetical protein
MKKTYQDFEALTDQLWSTDRHKYGSVQFPAKEALTTFEKEGVENAQELYDEYRKRQGGQFYYAGD